MTYSLRAAVQDALENYRGYSPAQVASAVLATMPTAEYRGALELTLTNYVRQVNVAQTPQARISELSALAQQADYRAQRAAEAAEAAERNEPSAAERAGVSGLPSGGDSRLEDHSAPARRPGVSAPAPRPVQRQTVGQHASRRVAGIGTAWMSLLQRQITGADGYVVLAQASVADLEHYSDLLRTHASRTARSAEAYHELAQRMRAQGVDRVKDLDPGTTTRLIGAAA